MARGTEDDNPHPLDIALGVRVRARRKELKRSQAELATACGITFQQVQKYEHGTNRISFSRLVEIAHALDCSVGDLVGDLGKKNSRKVVLREQTYLAEPGAVELLGAYASIEASKSRRAVLSLARQLAIDRDESIPSVKKSMERQSPRQTVRRR